jgi:hypothetical protein
MCACTEALDWVSASRRTWRELLRHSPEWAAWAMARRQVWCRALLDAGADVTVLTPELLRQIEHSDAGALRMLIGAGLDVHADDDAALRWSAIFRRTDIVRLLLAAGADVHAQDDAPLRSAAMRMCADVVRILLAAGADVHARDDAPLWNAVFTERTKNVRILLAAGANAHAQDGAIIDLARSYGRVEILRLLLAAA